MPVTEMANARKCGQIRFYAIYEYPFDLNTILEMCHLKPKADRLLTIDQETAVATLVCWLRKDAAYGNELMSERIARKLAKEFVEAFGDKTSRFLTNGDWAGQENPIWEPMTETVFDGGILIISGSGKDTRHVCLWFEDED